MFLKQKFLLLLLSFTFLPMTVVFGQFVEDPSITDSVNAPAIETAAQVLSIFDVLILLSALLFIISIFGLGIGILKLVTSGGDEMTAESATNMLVLSGWSFGASVLSYLLINLFKYFIY